jgi:GNAT superfamily N-acetyltransferase
MKEEEIPDYNIFMMCTQLNKSAMSELGNGYRIRNCRPDELETWKAFPFDTEAVPPEYEAFMDQIIHDTYARDMETFYQNTLFICDQDDHPVATCSHWKAYGKFQSIHWLKTRKSHEGKGLGRALMSVIMARFQPEDYPIYLHTQPGSFRAIKLYADFGFQLLAGGKASPEGVLSVGSRTNDLDLCLPILEAFIPAADFEQIGITPTPPQLIAMLEQETSIQF